MEEKVEALLLELAKCYQTDEHTRKALANRTAGLAKKIAEQNPLENSMWENMLDGALKAIEVVAVASFDWKLTSIVALFRSWLKDKREEKQKRQQDMSKGVNYGITHPQFTVQQYDPYGGRSTY